METTSDISFKRKALLLTSAWVAAALAMTIIRPSSWSFFWLFANCSPITWILGFLVSSMTTGLWLYSLMAVGWLYYVALTVCTFKSNRRWVSYGIYALILASLALNVEGCREVTAPHAFKQ